jgi:hypothetical protein
VSVTKMRDTMSMDYGGMECEDMLFPDFLNYWKSYILEGHDDSVQPCLYLKVRSECFNFVH